jgi:unsaturated chondroitin disaccharide hydrolase
LPLPSSVILLNAHPDRFPIYTTHGKWDLTGEAWTNWCEGFLGGQLWLLYTHTGEDFWRQKAEHYSRLIEERKFDRAVHDLGFLFWPTWKRWYDLTGDPDLKRVVIQAGQTLAQRFQEKGNICALFWVQIAFSSIS